MAPNDHHLLIERGYVRVAKGPKENRFRPAVDPLFRSAAYLYSTRVIGVVLSGALDDGTAGLWAIKMRGGTAVVQDPADAVHRSMPLSALDNVTVDHQLPARQIGPLLGRLAREQAEPEPILAAEARNRMEAEIKIARECDPRLEDILQYGDLSPFTCPECHGVLSMFRDGRWSQVAVRDDDWQTSVQASVAAYLDAVTTGREPPVSGAAALETIRLLHRIYDSAVIL